MQSNKVLIADDDNFVCESLSKILKQFNLESEKYLDGVECVTAYKKNQNIRFILMDVNMPNLDGYEATKEIREFEKSKGLAPCKIYGLSADDSAQSKKSCIESGMTDQLVKPLTKAKLQGLM